MSDFQHKPDSGSIFKNDKREKETHPNGTGDALIGGKMYWISAWTNTRDDGSKYQKLTFKLKEQKASEKPRQELPADDFQDDDLPF